MAEIRASDKKTISDWLKELLRQLGVEIAGTIFNALLAFLSNLFQGWISTQRKTDPNTAPQNPAGERRKPKVNPVRDEDHPGNIQKAD